MPPSIRAFQGVERFFLGPTVLWYFGNLGAASIEALEDRPSEDGGKGLTKGAEVVCQTKIKNTVYNVTKNVRGKL